MGTTTSLAAGLAALLAAWPKIRSLLPAEWVAKLPGFMQGATKLDPAEVPACMTDPASEPPPWVKDWVKLVITESGKREPEFMLSVLGQGKSLYRVAQLARDVTQSTVDEMAKAERARLGAEKGGAQ